MWGRSLRWTSLRSRTLCTFMIGIGLFPAIMVPMVQTGVDNILRLLGGALDVHVDRNPVHPA